MPAILITGRANVGKSTLFNRLSGQRSALVFDAPGVTRDLRCADTVIQEHPVTLIDSPGLDILTPLRGDRLPQDAAEQERIHARAGQRALQALEHSAVIILLLDARAGLLPADQTLAQRLRPIRQRVIVAVNKCERQQDQGAAGEAIALGLGTPIPISALHGEGIVQLQAALLKALEAHPSPPEAPPQLNSPAIRLALIGRPNTGKSTLVNMLLQRDAQLTSPEAGATREAIEHPLQFQQQPFMLIDTAGLRRKARIRKPLESSMARTSQEAIRRTHVTALVLDATCALEKQDLTLARLVIQAGKPLMLIANKWDLLSSADAKATRHMLESLTASLLGRVRGLPCLPISAIAAHDHARATILKAAQTLHLCWSSRIPTARLNRWLHDAVTAHPPPLAAGKTVQLRYATQVATQPPSIVIFANHLLASSYLRYLENTLRAHFVLEGTPIKIMVRKGKNPYGDSP